MKPYSKSALKGKVVEIKKGIGMTRLFVDIGGGDNITANVKNEALKELDVNVGDELEFLKHTGDQGSRVLH